MSLHITVQAKVYNFKAKSVKFFMYRCVKRDPFVQYWSNTVEAMGRIAAQAQVKLSLLCSSVKTRPQRAQRIKIQSTTSPGLICFANIACRLSFAGPTDDIAYALTNHSCSVEKFKLFPAAGP
jgi:hypothetical protein